jgi:dTMP kinase
MKRLSRGAFVSFEGCEGSGKSTQARLLEETLRAGGFQTILVREPGGTAVGEGVRSLLLDPDRGPRTPRAELLLYLASRAELTERVIRPALAEGRVVIADRYVDASVAYQGGGRALGSGSVRRLNRFATGDLLPDLTFLLDIAPERGLERAAGRTVPDRLERESLAFHRAVRRAYRALARSSQDSGRFIVIDAEAPVPAVASRVSAAVVALLDQLSGKLHGADDR